jgi:PmbA protein
VDSRETALRAVESAMAAGASEAEAFIEWSKETEVMVRTDKVDTISRSEDRGLGLRVFVDGRLGFAFTSDFTGATIRDLGTRTVAAAREATPDEYNALPESEAISGADLGIFDPELAELSIEQKIEAAKAIATDTRAADRRIVATDRCIYRDASGSTVIANSHGLFASYQSAYCVGFVIAIAEESGDRMMGFGGDATRVWREFDTKKIGREAARRACAPLRGTPIDSGKMTVVMDPTIASEFFGTLTMGLSAKLLQTGRSMFIGKMGQKVGADIVTIVDDGRVPGALGSAPFDGEGVPSRRRVLIDKGVVVGEMHNTYTARKAGAKSTGNAVRSYRDTPEIGAQNPSIVPWAKTPEEIIADVADGIYLVQGRNVGGINPVTGMYSIAGFGQRIENGKLTTPVSGITVSGHMLEMLTNVVAIGSDFVWDRIGGDFGSCTIAIEGMAIGGA